MGNQNQPKHAVYVGRFAPFHLGHAKVVDCMIEKYSLSRCLFVIGSCNASLSMRHLFSYTERRQIVRTIYPKARMVGLGDFPTDEEWMIALDDILKTARINPLECEFQGGCYEDIQFFLEANRKCNIINRFDQNASIKISATEIRDCLIHGGSLEGMLDVRVIPIVKDIFSKKWAIFKKI